MLNDIAPYVALGAAVLAVVLLVLVVVLLVRVGRLRRAQSVVLGRHEQRDIVAHTEDLDDQVRNLREAVEILTDELDRQKRHLDRALTNRAIVRYDAFRDAGGEQSASFALLDQYRSGVVLSSIAARDFARVYVKYVTDGVPDRDFSPEEVQAVEAAVPQPLRRDDEGAKARRAPLPERKPPAALRAGEDEEPAGAPDATADEADRARDAKTSNGAAAGGTPERDPRTPPASPAQAAAAFEALGDAVAPEGEPGTPEAGPAPADDDFTWEPPGPPRGGAPSR